MPQADHGYLAWLACLTSRSKDSLARLGEPIGSPKLASKNLDFTVNEEVGKRSKCSYCSYSLELRRREGLLDVGEVPTTAMEVRGRGDG